MRTCEQCPNQLHWRARSDARFCSTKCRVAAHRARPDLPHALTSQRRWIRRDANKVPKQLNWRNASSTNEATWTDYASADASNVGAGLGFVLNGDGIICIDIDHCFDADGVLEQWAADFVASLPATFCERSPSGDGLHVWGTCKFSFPGRKAYISGGHVEAYSSERYITITKQPIGTCRRLADLTKVVTELI